MSGSAVIRAEICLPSGASRLVCGVSPRLAGGFQRQVAVTA
jgi:hypothetical protein